MSIYNQCQRFRTFPKITEEGPKIFRLNIDNFRLISTIKYDKLVSKRDVIDIFTCLLQCEGTIFRNLGITLVCAFIMAPSCKSTQIGYLRWLATLFGQNYTENKGMTAFSLDYRAHSKPVCSRLSVSEWQNKTRGDWGKPVPNLSQSSLVFHFARPRFPHEVRAWNSLTAVNIPCLKTLTNSPRWNCPASWRYDLSSSAADPLSFWHVKRLNEFSAPRKVSSSRISTAVIQFGL